jgi:hypothetical protein
MQRSIEERDPVADLGRAWVVEDRCDRPVRVRALEEEHDLGLRQEDRLSIEGRTEDIIGRVSGEKLLRSLATAGFQASHEYVTVHGGKSVLRWHEERGEPNA